MEDKALQENIPTHSSGEEVESSKVAYVPIVRLNSETGKDVPVDVTYEVEKAALMTLRLLGVDMSSYEKIPYSGDLVDLDAKDETGNYTFIRKPGTDNTLVIVISASPLFGLNGDEYIAHETEGGVVMLNLCKLDDAFSSDGDKLTEAQKAGIVAIEEVIHFVQHQVWKERFSPTEDFQTTDKIKEHYEHPIEKEANRWKRKVYDELYPELDLKIRGIDY